MKPKFFFDYIYYRITKAYFKWDGRSGITAIIAITMIQTFPVLLILMYFVGNIFDQEFKREHIGSLSSINGIIILIGIVLNYKKYNGNYNVLRKYWQDESERKRKIKGVIIVILILTVCLSFGLLNILPSFGPIFHKAD